jgi:hypothetical protein
MTGSGHDDRTLPQALTPAGSSGAALRPAKPNSDRQTAIWVIVLGAVVHMLRSRRLYERAAFAAIVLAALAALGGLDKESRAKNFNRLIAWAKMQDDRLESKVKDALT